MSAARGTSGAARRPMPTADGSRLPGTMPNRDADPAGLFDADTYTATVPRFLVVIGTVAEVVGAPNAETARARVIGRRFPIRGRGEYAARVLPPAASEITVRPITDAEEAAYASAEKGPGPIALDPGRAPTEGKSP